MKIEIKENKLLDCWIPLNVFAVSFIGMAD
jgi:hypothetical protein